MKAEPTPFDQKLFLVFITTFAAMTAFEFAGQFLYPYPPDWRSNLVTSLFTSGIAVIIAYFPLNTNYARNVQLLSEIGRRHAVEKALTGERITPRQHHPRCTRWYWCRI